MTFYDVVFLNNKGHKVFARAVLHGGDWVVSSFIDGLANEDRWCALEWSGKDALHMTIFDTDDGCTQSLAQCEGWEVLSMRSSPMGGEQ